MIVAFVDELRAEGHAVESICRVLREQGCQIAARTYRDWARSNRHVATRTVSDATVTDLVRDLAWRVDHEGVRRLTPEGLYGRRRMTALVRRTRPEASPGSVDRAMRSLALQGIRRSKGIRTTIPGKDGRRAGDLLDRDFTAAAPNRTWVMDFTYVRGREGHPVVRGELIGHADAGSQYTSIVFTDHLADEGIKHRSGRSAMPTTMR